MKQNYTDLLAVKYKIHGRNKKEGFDCFGLVLEVLRRNNIFIPDFFNDNTLNSPSYFSKLEDLEDLCIIHLTDFNKLSHIAIYIGTGMMIHARADCGVIIEPVERYAKKIMGYYKVNS